MSHHKIILGDCLEGLGVLDDESVDLVLTDPPHGLNIDYGGYYDDTQENLKVLIDQTMPEMMRVGRRVAIMSGIRPLALYPKPTWILCFAWNTTGSRGYYGYTQWLPILVYGQDLKGVGLVNGILKSDLKIHKGGNGVGFLRDGIDKKHPCPKPVASIEWLVKRLSNEGDTILDPFAGSFTTAKVARDLNRNSISIEINPDYWFNIGETRLKANIPTLDNSVSFEVINLENLQHQGD